VSVTMVKEYADLLHVADNVNSLVVGFPGQSGIDALYHIALRKISHIALDGQMEAALVTNIVSPWLRLELAGNASLSSGDNQIKSFMLTTIGSGKSVIELAGTASFQELIFSDNARYNALRVKTKYVRVVGFGSSKILLCLERHDNGKGRRLQSTVSYGLSERSIVHYQGNPRITQLWHKEQACIERIAS
jgi:hypothetical protein